MKKIAIVAPVHCYNDVRVFQKQAITLAKEGYQIVLLARAPKVLVEKGIKIQPVPAYSNRVMRFLKLPLILQQAWIEKADLYHLHNPDTLPLAFALKL